jgi:hypothetical protein
MKRDMDLIRSILLALEARDESVEANRVHDHLRIAGHDDRVVALHVKLLEDAAFLEADYMTVEGHGIVFARPYRITWQGYEFLAAASNEGAWNSVKTLVKSKSPDVPFSVLQSLLIETAKKAVGL